MDTSLCRMIIYILWSWNYYNWTEIFIEILHVGRKLTNCNQNTSKSFFLAITICRILLLTMVVILRRLLWWLSQVILGESYVVRLMKIWASLAAHVTTAVLLIVGRKLTNCNQNTSNYFFLLITTFRDMFWNWSFFSQCLSYEDDCFEVCLKSFEATVM